MAKRRYSLDEILDHVRDNGPRSIHDLSTRLVLEDAEWLVARLKKEGVSVEVYDLPSTTGVWKVLNRRYARQATKRLVEVLAAEEGVDYKTVEEFRQLLPKLVINSFREKPINLWGTKLSGMISSAYGNSPSAAVLDLVYLDDDFTEIRKVDLQPYDFFHTPAGIWIGEDNKPTAIARQATKRLVEVLAAEEGVDYKTVEGFRQLIPRFTQESFFKKPINQCGTLLGGMLLRAYDDSPSAAVLDLVNADDEFVEIRRVSLQSYDFVRPSHGTWTEEDGRPSVLARQATKKFVEVLAAEEGVDYKTVEGFKKLLPRFRVALFQSKQINLWGTKLSGMISSAYGNSPSAAVLDLVYLDDDFTEIRKVDLQPYDFFQTPAGIWIGEDNKPTAIARQATKRLVEVLAAEEGVDYKTVEGFKQLLPHFKLDILNKKLINLWGTTLTGMISSAYGNSPSAAVLDLVYLDDDFVEIQRVGLRVYDFPSAPLNTWVEDDKPSSIARQATKKFVEVLAAEEGVDYKTVEGFRKLLPRFVQQSFFEKMIDVWETTLKSMLANAYGNSPSAAVLDLVYLDDDFVEIQRVGLRVYDFPRAPLNTWVEDDKPSSIARQATKKFVEVLAAEEGVDYKTVEGFRKLLPRFTANSFYKKPINVWGTTLEGMLESAYNSSPKAAILDLIQSDPDFRRISQTLIVDSLRGSPITRIDRAEGRYSTKQLRQQLTRNGLDLSEFDFYSFSGGEKSAVRELLADEALRYLGDGPLAYFGLEGPTFGSYFALANAVAIDAKQSLVPEKNRRNYTVMERIKRMKSVNKLLNGSSIYSLELLCQTAEEALRSTAKTFDLVFLDWLGFLSPSGIRELNLAYDHLHPKGIIAVTLNTNPLSESRYQRVTGFSGSQDDYVKRWAIEKSMTRTDMDYVGGDTITLPMKMYIMKR